MMKENSAPQFFLFPHTTLSEADCGTASLLFPGFQLLRVLRSPVVPERDWCRASIRPVIRDEELLGRIGAVLRGYREFADLHGESKALTAIAREWKAEAVESRFGIQSEIRGKKTVESQPGDRWIVEAAVFLEMARDLDEKELELEASYHRVGRLESEFRKILGIGEDEEAEEGMDALKTPLISDGSAFAFMLRHRAACWLRLFMAAPPAGRHILVTPGAEVVEELLDPLRAWCERTGKTFSVQRIPLISVPDFRVLTSGQIQTLMAASAGSEPLESFASALRELAGTCGEELPIAGIGQAAGVLETHLDRICSEAGIEVRERRPLHLVCLVNTTLRDLWECLDREAFEDQAERSVAANTVAPLILIEPA